MSLDDISLDGSEIWGTSSETPSEKSEKQKESSRKAQSQLQKTQKDEKKAKQDNDDLFLILSKFIKNPLYEELIPSVVLLLQNSYPSRFILITIALIYPEASHYLFLKLGKNIQTDIYTKIHHYDQVHEFHDDHLDTSIRDWVTLWMTSAQEFLSQNDSSVILHQKMLDLFSSPMRSIAEKSVSVFFSFFLHRSNVTIEPKKSETYALFIISEYEKVIRTFIDTADEELKKPSTINTNDFFGMT